MRKNIKNNLEYILALVIIAVVLGIFTTNLRNSIDYLGRSILLIVIFCLITFLCYRIIKHQRRFAIRTFTEIIDHILCANMWKQLGSLLALSIAAFLVSWLFVDALPLSDDFTNPELARISKDHNTFWLTICYFFDQGNLNLTPFDSPGWLGGVSLIVAILGMTLLTGLFISTFTNIIERRVNMVKSGTVTYKKISSHSVVIGFCDLTESVIRGLLERSNDSKVILLSNHDINDVSKSLYNLLHSNAYDGRIVLYSGDYRMTENLQRLNLQNTQSIYILGDDEMQSRDYENLATAQKVSDICAKSGKYFNNGKTIPLYVRMDRMPSFSTLQRLDIDKDFFSDRVYFRPFNYYEHWTRMLWVKRQVSIYDVAGDKRTVNYPSLFYDQSKEGQKKFVHLVVSGFSEMGMAITLQAIRLAHYGNYLPDKSLRTKITVVDPNMEELKSAFLAQFRHLEQIYDIDIDFKNCRLEDIDEDVISWSLDKHQMLTLAICLGDADTALSQALSLPLEVYYQFGRNSEELPRILVRQKSLSGIWKMLENRDHEELITKQDDISAFRKGKYNKYRNIHPFGMLVSGFYPDDMDDLKACLTHIDFEDTWMCQDKTDNEKITIENLYSLVKSGDKEQLNKKLNEAFSRWHRLQENTKWANRYQTDIHLHQKGILNAAGITTPEQITTENAEVLLMCSDIEHRRWVAERVLLGWQQSPYMKDGSPMRQDSLLLHYDITPDVGEEKKKDENFVRNILMLDAIYDFYKNK